MPLAKGQGIRQAIAEVSALPLLSLKAQKSRLFRIPRESIPSHIFNPKDSTHLGVCKFFALRHRRLNQDVVDNVNKGPPYIAGAYPPGLLHARHEKYRLINHVNVDTWRTGDEVEKDHQEAEDRLRQLSMQRIPILGDDESNNQKVPTLIITSKKKVHKLSVVRHQVSKKLWNAFDMAVKQLQGTPGEVGKVSKWLYLIVASEEAHKAKVEDVALEMVKMLKSQGSLTKVRGESRRDNAETNKVQSQRKLAGWKS